MRGFFVGARYSANCGRSPLLRRRMTQVCTWNTEPAATDFADKVRSYGSGFATTVMLLPSTRRVGNDSGSNASMQQAFTLSNAGLLRRW